MFHPLKLWWELEQIRSSEFMHFDPLNIPSIANLTELPSNPTKGFILSWCKCRGNQSGFDCEFEAWVPEEWQEMVVRDWDDRREWALPELEGIPDNPVEADVEAFMYPSDLGFLLRLQEQRDFECVCSSVMQLIDWRWWAVLSSGFIFHLSLVLYFRWYMGIGKDDVAAVDPLNSLPAFEITKAWDTNQRLKKKVIPWLWCCRKKNKKKEKSAEMVLMVCRFL